MGSAKPGWRARFNMTPNELATAGRALYGERWQTSLAVNLQVADRTMRRWLAGDTTIPDGVERELREVLIQRVKEIGNLIGYSVNSSDRSVLHYPTNAAFRYDDFGNVTMTHPGAAAWEEAPRLIEGAKEAVRQERERDKATAVSFVRESAWWYSHPSGPVRAPGHADGLHMSPHGWAVDFGANTFLVGKAIERCRKVLDQCREEAATGQVVLRSDIESRLKKTISGCVANSAGQEYSGYYPIRDNTLIFGAQGIGVDDGADFMIALANLRWDGEALARPQPPADSSAMLAIEKLPFNPVFLAAVDELELSVRAANCLKNEKIVYIGDLVQKTEAEMLRIPNFGRRSLNEIKEVLAGMGLHINMEVPDWPPGNLEALAQAYAERKTDTG